MRPFFRETGLSGLVSTYFIDDKGEITIRRSQEVSAVLENNKALYNSGDGYSQSRDFRAVAEIPFGVLEIWRGEGINIHDPNHADIVKRKLNSNEFRYLRTAEGWI